MRWLVLFLIGCAPPPPVKWNYGETWGGLCSKGKSQSPIDLHLEPGFTAKIQLEYWPTTVKATNDGHTIQLQYDPGSKLIGDGKHYDLQEIQLHRPSEHLLNGKSFPMEMQLMHKSPEGKRVIVGVFFVEGAANRWLQPVFEQLPDPGETREPGARVSVADLISTKRAFLYYQGSLTTPPCSEGVDWYVMTTPVEVSAEQIAAFDRRFHDNHRPPQPLGARHVIGGEAK